jgi:hypothetical protein
MSKQHEFTLWALCFVACALSSLSCDHSPGSSSDAGIQPLQGLSYTTPAVYSLETPIPENRPKLQQGVASQYSITPALPDGLTFDPQTGVLSGTAYTTSPYTCYSVTASNGTSSVTAALGLMVTTPGTFCVTDPDNKRVFLVDTSNPSLEQTIDFWEGDASSDKSYAVVYGSNRFAVISQPEQGRGHITLINLNNHNNPARVLQAGERPNDLPLVLQVGEKPIAVAYGSKYFAVLNQGSGTLTWVDASSDATSDSVYLGNDLSALAFGDNRFAVVQQGSPAWLFLFNPKDSTPDSTTVIPDGTYVDIAFGDGNFLLVNQWASRGVLVSAKDGSIVGTPFTLGANPVAVAYGNGAFAVTNAYGNSVAMIKLSDPQNPPPLVPVGLSPQAIAYGNGYFVVCNFAENTVSILDTAHNAPLATIQVAYSPSPVVFGNNRFLIRHRYNEAVFLLDVTQGRPRLQGPNIPIASSPFSTTAFSSPEIPSLLCVAGGDASQDRVNLIDSNYDNVVRTITFQRSPPTAPALPRAVAYGNGLFAVANCIDKKVMIINRAKQQVDATLDVSPKVSAIAFGNNYFAAVDQSDDKVCFINTQNLSAALQWINVGNQPVAVAFGYIPDAVVNNKFAVVNKGNNYVTIIGLANGPYVDATSDTGTTPVAVAFGNNQFAVVNQIPGSENGSVTFIDASDDSVLETVEVGKKPVAVAFGNNKFAVVNQGDNSLRILDAVYPYDTLADISTGFLPSVVIYANNHFVVINQGESTVTLINATTNEYVAGIVLPGGTAKALCFINNRYAAALRESQSVAIMDAIYNLPITALTYNLLLPEAMAASD